MRTFSIQQKLTKLDVDIQKFDKQMETISDYKYDIHKEMKNLEIIEEDLAKKLNDLHD